MDHMCIIKLRGPLRLNDIITSYSPSLR
uniref:Uncharacterized protein n=1 Tax=Rhizophora mucronata TaxID=61149 RepID=A0A2P2M6L7_RHIMU